MRLVKRPQFLLDLAEELTNLNNKAGSDIAERWYQSLEMTVQQLKTHPYIGRKRLDLKPEGIRSWRLKKYSRWLIFYFVRENDLILLRVRYASMDLPALQFQTD